MLSSIEAEIVASQEFTSDWKNIGKPITFVIIFFALLYNYGKYAASFTPSVIIFFANSNKFSCKGNNAIIFNIISF